MLLSSLKFGGIFLVTAAAVVVAVCVSVAIVITAFVAVVAILDDVFVV